MQIILNADDFGKSPSRNLAIDTSFKQGLISSAGLIVTGQYLDEAVALMEAGGYHEQIHIHFNLSANLLAEGSKDMPQTEAMKTDPFFCKDGKFLPYHGLPRSFFSIFKWKKVYLELVAQFEKFKAVTKGRADYSHVDFHLWYNLTWPVSVALRRFTRKYKIKSVRYLGIHQRGAFRNKLYCYVSRDPRVKYIPASNIDYYLSKRQLFEDYSLVELYCHPNYKNGVLLDDSPSYLKHDRQPLTVHLQKLKDTGDDISFLPWGEV